MARLVVAVALGALGAACSLVVDFDRSKVHSSETGGHTGSGGRGSGGQVPASDSGQGGTPETGGGAGTGGVISSGGTAGDGGGDAPPPACDPKTHAGCAADELCCETTAGPACKKTSLDECESCGVACPKELSAACVSRTCECEPQANRACSGTSEESFCLVPPSGTPSCVECRDGTDCSANATGAECVANECVQCDPKRKSAGCSGNTPICDPDTNTCKPCSMQDDDCGGTLKCTTSGACGGCANSATDCATPNTPICDATTTLCRGCMDDAECVSERGLPFCVNQERCAVCKPTTEEGCSDPANPDCRFDSNGTLACLPCTADAQCEGRAATPVCNVSSGHCVECALDNDCTGNAKKPLCVANACVACDASVVTGDADALCAAKAGDKVACVRSGTQQGECGACDPVDSIPCAANQLCCETSGIAACAATSATQCAACGTPCDPTVANTCSNRSCGCGSGPACSGSGTEKFCVGSPGRCAGCADDGDCTSATAPLCEGNQCVACDAAASANARCMAKGAGACASTGAHKGRCSACDPGTDFGCSSGSAQNQCDPATATCVDCVDNGGCDDASTKPICGSNSCRGCASDAECGALGGAAGPLCGASGACGADAACSADTDCLDGVHGQCVDIGSGVERCRACDPSNDDGCDTGKHCSAAFVCGP